MRSLQEIIRDNEKAANTRKVEDNFNRDCSWTGDVHGGIVLHSARQRSTGYLKPGAQSRRFLRLWNMCNSQEAKNRIVENYFWFYAHSNGIFVDADERAVNGQPAAASE
jgi:hypothetical protein